MEPSVYSATPPGEPNIQKRQPAEEKLAMVSYHTTPELLSLITGMNCPGMAYHTVVRNQTDDGKDLTVVTVGADSPHKSSTKDKLRIMLTFGIHGREYFASEVALKYVPRGHSLPSTALYSPRIAPAGRT